MVKKLCSHLCVENVLYVCEPSNFYLGWINYHYFSKDKLGKKNITFELVGMYLYPAI